jgi:predicted ABC-type ATPase
VKELIVYAGPNGSGKSSLRDILNDTTEVVIDPDRLAREINPDQPRTADYAAGRRAVRLFHAALEDGRSISLETTLTGRTVMARLHAARAASYGITLIYIALHSAELNVQRVAQRVSRGGHAIEPSVVRRRVAESQANLPQALALAHRAVVLDNSGPAHRRLLEIRNRSVVFESPDMPDWLKRRLPTIRMVLAPT